MSKIAPIAALLLALPIAGCSIGASPTAPIQVVPPPAEGAVTGPVITMKLRFGSQFAPDSMKAFNIDNDFSFAPSNLCPAPKPNGSSVIGARLYVNGKFRCNPFSLYFYPNAVPGMPHWHKLSVIYTCGSHCLLPLGPQTKGRGFIFRPPYLVLSPARKGVPSESVSLGTLTFSRTTARQPWGYAEQVAVQNPAPPAGIVVTLSNIPADTQVCARDVDCGRPGTAVTIAGGSKAALFYLRPFPNVRRVGKRRFTIAAVAKGCEMGTAGGTIDYDR